MPDVQAARITIPVTTGAGKATVDMEGLNKALEKAGIKIKGVTNETKKSQSSFRGLKLAAGAALAAIGTAGLVRAFKDIIKVTQEQQKVEAQLNAVLKSTKNAAGLTATQIKKMASELQGVTTFGDEAIISAQNMLLTFTKIGGDVFPGATEAVLNLSAAMGTDLKTQAIQVGKALNDPILGLTALRRVGIQLSSTQEEQVKKFVKLGQTAKAQKIILQELETQFGGVARAMTKTVGGAFAQLNNRVGDLKEDVGNALTPDLIKLSEAFFRAAGDGGLFQKALGAITLVARTAISLITNLINTLNRIFDDKIQAQIKSGEAQVSSMVDVYKRWVDIAKKNLEQAKAQGASESKLIDLRLKLENATAELRGQENALGKAKERTKNILGPLNAEGEKENALLKKATANRRAANTSIEDANKLRKEALSILAATGDLSSQLALQEMQFAEQKKAVAAAGLNVAQLEQFQAQQRLNAIKNFITQSVEAEKGGILAKQEALNEAYFMALENDALSWEQKLAAQQAYNDASISLEQQRAREIAATTQLIGQGALQVSGILSAISQVRQNEMQQEIMNMEAAGASQEELDKKRKQLAKKAAKDQKKFGIISVIINTAMAVTKALASVPPPASYVLAAISAAAGLAQLAVIQSQPVPAQFGGSFVVPPGNEADSGLLRVNQGEEVSVTPVRETEQGGTKQIIVMIDNRQFDAYLIDKMNQNLNNGSVQITRGGIVKTA